MRQIYDAFLQPLRTGEIIAEGDPSRPNDRREILPTIWSHKHYYFDVRNGDVVEWRDYEEEIEVTRFEDGRENYEVRWRAVSLRPANPGLILTPFSNRQLPSKAAVNADRTISARTKCREWLINEMRKCPAQRPFPKQYYRDEAFSRFKIGPKAFDTVWQQAIDAAPAPAWSKAGRPRKLPPQ